MVGPGATSPTTPPATTCRGKEQYSGSVAADSATALDKIEALLSEFCALHRWNARRIFLLGKMGRIASEEGRPQDEELVQDVLDSIAAAEAPHEEIAAALRRRTPPEMAAIYRSQGLQEGIHFLEELVTKEDLKAGADRAAGPYHNLAFLYYLSSRVPDTDNDRKEALLSQALELLGRVGALLRGHAGINPAARQGLTPKANSCMARASSLAALIHLARNDDARCRQELQTVCEYDPTLPEGHFARGIYCLRQTDYDGAVRELESAVEGGADVAEYAFHLARAYCRKRDVLASRGETDGVAPGDSGRETAALYDQAVSLLRRAVQIDRQYAIAHLKLGILTLEKDCDEAVEHFGNALRADPALVATIARIRCPRRCRRCNGTKLKILLLKLVSTYQPPPDG